MKAFQKEACSCRRYTREVKLVLPIAELALYNADMEEVIEPGEFELQIGSASDDIRIRRTIISEVGNLNFCKRIKKDGFCFVE